MLSGLFEPVSNGTRVSPSALSGYAHICFSTSILVDRSLSGIVTITIKEGRMAVETVFAQITHEALSASRTKTLGLSVCCICGLLRDETEPSRDQERWVSQRSYRKTHGVQAADSLLTRTYCPTCFTQVKERMREGQDSVSGF